MSAGISDLETVVSLYRDLYNIHKKDFDSDISYLPEDGNNLDNMLGTNQEGRFLIFGIFDFPYLNHPSVVSLRQDATKLAKDMIHQQILLKTGGVSPKEGDFKMDDLLGENVIYRITTNQNVIIHSAMDNGAMISFCPISGACKANGRFVQPTELDDEAVARVILPYKHLTHTEYNQGYADYFQRRGNIIGAMHQKMKEKQLHPILFHSYGPTVRLDLVQKGVIDKYLNLVGMSREDYLVRLKSLMGDLSTADSE